MLTLEILACRALTIINTDAQALATLNNLPHHGSFGELLGAVGP